MVDIHVLRNVEVLTAEHAKPTTGNLSSLLAGPFMFQPWRLRI